MLKLSDGMLLYHGGYCEVKTPDLAKCADFKDFGKGFYLTSDKEQAKNFINTSLKKYDIIGGKIADDATNVTIIAYLIGAYGIIGSGKADSLCISRLIPERLKNQFCFRTEAGLECLSFVESEQIWKS